MLLRWLCAVLLMAIFVVTAFGFSSAARYRHAAKRRAPSVADVVTGRGQDSSLPSVPEVDDPAPATSPAITY